MNDPVCFTSWREKFNEVPKPALPAVTVTSHLNMNEAGPQKDCL